MQLRTYAFGVSVRIFLTLQTQEQTALLSQAVFLWSRAVDFGAVDGRDRPRLEPQSTPHLKFAALALRHRCERGQVAVVVQ